MLIQNAALLCKWWWRYGVEKDSLWVKAINGKYGVSGSKWLPSQISNTARFSKVWSDICDVSREGSNFEMIIAESFWIKVGSGMNTSFWEDTWLGNQPKTFSLIRKTPRLGRYSIPPPLYLGISSLVDNCMTGKLIRWRS